MFRLRMVGHIIKDAGLRPLTLAFTCLFALCGLAVFALDPNVGSLGDALWFCYQAISTIGFGDIPVTNVAARAVTVILSLCSIFYLAVITGAVVNACAELAAARRKENLMQFMDQLEHVDELSREELADLAQQVRAFRKRQSLR